MTRFPLELKRTSHFAEQAVRVEAHDRKRLEQLCRTITRPALSDERVQLNAAGQVELKLKTPWRDGTTHLVMSPLEFMQRLAARATEGCSSGTRAAAAAAPHPVPWGAGTQR
ncbi:MAG: transposase, partial [Betaproteobacteria bacterium]